MFIRKGYEMPPFRIIKGVRYQLYSMEVFSGDKDRKVAFLKSRGAKVKVFVERHEKDNTGAWIIYATPMRD